MPVNAMEVSPHDAYEVILEGWIAQKEHGLHQSYMLHGEPGVGKTQIIEKLARDIGATFHDVRLTTIETSDLRGLPYYDHETKMTIFYRPEDLPKPDATKPSVLFLDELTSASPFLQPTVYGLLQERRVGQHKLPDNCLIVAAGNGTADGAVAYEMGTAIANRLCHMTVVQDAESWINNFAIPNDLDPAVIAFIKARPDLLHTIQLALKNNDLVASTGRSWEAVSQIRKHVKSKKAQQVQIAGRVGSATAAAFWTVANDIDSAVQVTEMFKVSRDKRVAMYPKTLDGLNALVFGTIGHMTEENMEAAIEIMVDLGNLTTLRPDEEAFKMFPIGELATHGNEAMMTKAIKLGLAEKFATSPAYQAYYQSRKELGLTRKTG